MSHRQFLKPSWLRRHPLLAYFALAYAISWGGIAIVLAVLGFDLAALRPAHTGLIFVSMLLGPSVSGLLLTALLDGRAGLRQLGSRLTRWKIGAGWYAVALLAAPLLLIAILFSLSVVVSPSFAPRFQWPLLAIGLVAGGFEEIGWTGFATPRLLARQRPGMAGLSLGVLWALWHGPVAFLYRDTTLGGSWILSFVIVYVATLTPYRALMTWVSANTRSTFPAILMHASYSGWLLVLFPATSLTQSLVWQSAFAVMFWLAAAQVLRYSGPHVESPRHARADGVVH